MRKKNTCSAEHKDNVYVYATLNFAYLRMCGGGGRYTVAKIKVENLQPNTKDVIVFLVPKHSYQ